jgi:periplasmic protein TonB
VVTNNVRNNLGVARIPVSQSGRIYHQSRRVRNRDFGISADHGKDRRGSGATRFPQPVWHLLISLMSFSENRILIQALLFSVLFHAALLLGVARVYSPELGVPAVKINVVIDPRKPPDPIKPVAAAPDKPRSAPVSVPVPRPEPRKVTPVPPKSETRRVQAETPRIAVREPSPVAAPATAVPTDVSADSPRADVAHATLSPALPLAQAGGSAAGSETSALEGVSADDLRQYRVSLASAARRFKRYPALAREQGWEGTAEVAIRFRPALPSPEVVLVRSSGRDLLDEQAVEMLARAARATALPESMRGHDFQIPLPVKFSLDEFQ